MCGERETVPFRFHFETIRGTRSEQVAPFPLIFLVFFRPTTSVVLFFVIPPSGAFFIMITFIVIRTKKTIGGLRVICGLLDPLSFIESKKKRTLML